MVERDIEEVRADDIDQVGDDQRQAGGVGNEAGGDDEGQRRLGRELQAQQDRHDDGGQQQRGTVIGEEGRDHRPQQHDQRKQAASVATAPARHVQRRPGEEPGLVEDQGDQDQGDEGEGRIPNDVPHHQHIGQLHHPDGQGHRSAPQGAGTDTEALWLPDHQHQGHDEDGECQHGKLPVRDCPD